MNAIYITKKTHKSTPPKDSSIRYVKFETTKPIDEWLNLHRSYIIILKDVIYNSENLPVCKLNEKIDLVSNAINNMQPLPKDFVMPQGIKHTLEAKRIKREEAKV